MADGSLPIYAIESDIIARLRETGRLILSAPTGSGKSTQVPQMALQHGLLDRGQMVVLQPRRLATRLLAARVASELGVGLGEEVGYQIRFENVTSSRTRICFVTEGLLLRRMIDDPRLSGVSALVFDEFHERHLYGDVTLARALALQADHRPDLKLIVMSATLDSERLSEYLHPCANLHSQGRMYPVEIQYARRSSWDQRTPVWEQAAAAFSQYARDQGEGDILVFMPGSYEIHQTLEAIRRTHESKGYLLLPLHGELNPRDQDAAVARYDRPKVVVATNVAETSLTIDGVRLVIDSGLARIPRYDPYRGINTLLVERISRASADQRTGRAGRTAPGVCWRLWSEAEHADRAMHEKPEIQRLDLAEVVLMLKAAGVENLDEFPWLEAPDSRRLHNAVSLLQDLGALAVPDALTPSRITETGRRMLAFPLHPRYARMLLAADELGCVYQAALIAALTQGRDLLLRKVDQQTQERRERMLQTKAASDFFLLMQAWDHAHRNQFRLEDCRPLGIHATSARQVGPLLQQFLKTAERQGLDVEPREANEETLQKCILIGFSDRVARRLDAGTLRCELTHGRRGVLARESAVHHCSFLVVAEIQEIGRHGGDVSTILSLATAIQPSWIHELFPTDLVSRVRVQYDPAAKRVIAEEEISFRELALTTRKVDPPIEESSRLLADEVLAGRLTLKEWNHGVEQWIARLNGLAVWCPELALPPIRPEDRRHLVEQICHGAFSYKDIKERAVGHHVRGWLSSSQQELVDKHAPERLEIPNGKRPKVTYTDGADPYISLRIQELYGIQRLPQIGLGRVSVLLHILAPNMRPVQITTDLPGFWREHYPRIKSELQRKYPKHEWR